MPKSVMADSTATVHMCYITAARDREGVKDGLRYLSYVGVDVITFRPLAVDM